MEAIAKSVGRQIAAHRKAAGWTQAHLAERCGLSTETVGRLERGLQVPALPRLDQIARVLGIPLAALFQRGPRQSRQEEVLEELTALLRHRSLSDVELVRDVAARILRDL